MRLLSRIFSSIRSSLENEVLSELVELANLGTSTCVLLIKMVKEDDRSLVRKISKNEMHGDEVRRNVERLLFQGAFLPQSRHLFFTLAERMDNVIDRIEDCAKIYEATQRVDDGIRNHILEILDITKEACDCFCDALLSFFKGDETRMQEKIARINELESRIDDIKHEVFKNLVKSEDNLFWREKCTEDLIDTAEEISDNLQDAADMLGVIAASMKI